MELGAEVFPVSLLKLYHEDGSTEVATVIWAFPPTVRRKRPSSLVEFHLAHHFR